MAVRTLALPRTRLFGFVRVDVGAALLAILALQTAVSLSLRNTAFQDEALYIYAGRQLLGQWLGGPMVTEPYGSYFSGMPYVYPIIAGALDMLGGLQLVRLFSLLCMLCVTVCAFAITRHLFGRNPALLAAATLAVQGPVIFLGQMGTFDAMCLALLALAAWLTIPAGSKSLLWLPLVSAALVLAVASKYAGLLFVPTVLCLLVFQSQKTHGWFQALLRAGLCVAMMAIAPFAIRDQTIWAGLTSTTTNRTALLVASRMEILDRSLLWAGAVTALAAIGVFVLRHESRTNRLLYLLLLGTALLAPMYHLYKTEPTSLQKHVAFGLFFAAPLAGLALARISGYGPATVIGRRWPVGLAVVLILFSVGYNQAQGFFHEWGDTTSLIRVLRTQVRPGTGRILAEEAEVPRYYLQDIVDFWQWNHLYWFEYDTPAGQHLTGEAAYKAAIADGYWDIVELHYGANAKLAQAIDPGLRDGTRYELIAKLPFDNVYGGGYYWVWRRKS